MTKLTKFIAAAVVSLPLAIGTQVSARDTVVGLSSIQPPEALQEQIERVIGHAVSTLEPGEQLWFFNASNSALVTTFIAPAGNGAGNSKVMLQSNRQALGQLKRFIESAAPEPGRVGFVDTPGFLRAVRRNYPAGENGADLIVLGAPVLDDPQAPSLSMKGGRVPGDGHITARAGQSPYGTGGLSGSLEGYDFYFGLIGDPWEVSDAHAYRMERFWSLSAEGHGASMAYFGEDLNTLFGLAGHDAANHVHADPLVSTEKQEMLLFMPDTGAVADIYTQPLQVLPAPAPVWRAAENVRIGITWEVPQADIDLYVRPNPTAEVIYFGNANTAGGRLFKDFRNSPINGFETVALHGVVDLSATQIAVNFYSGSAPVSGLQGELRIAIGDQVWAAPFVLSAREGNRSEGAQAVVVNQVIPNDAWQIIDPVAVLTAE